MLLAQERPAFSDAASSATASTKSVVSLNSVDSALSLPFSEVGVVGREKELRMLQNVMGNLVKKFEKRAGSSPSPSPPSSTHSRRQYGIAPRDSDPSLAAASGSGGGRTLALIAGPSGSGKSTLAMHLKKEPFCQKQQLHRHGYQVVEGAAGTPVVSRDNCIPTNGNIFPGFFVSGKCDLSHQAGAKPFASVQSAMAELCQQILDLPDDDDNDHPTKRHDPRTLYGVCELLSSNLTATEVQVLSAFIPEIDKIVDHGRHGGSSNNGGAGGPFLKRQPSSGSIATNKTSASVTSSSNNNHTHLHRQEHDAKKKLNRQAPNYQERSNQTKFILRRFFQILCGYCPVVLVIDDLQWADAPSLDLIKSWLLDSEIPSLFIIACYRTEMLLAGSSDDKNAGSSNSGRMFQQTLAQLEESKQDRSLRIVKMDIGNLKMEQTKELVAELLSRPPTSCKIDAATRCMVDDAVVEELALVVHEQTEGNPFFVQQCLQSLVQEHQIVFEKDRHQWTCRMQFILQGLSASSGQLLHDYMKDKVQGFAPARVVLPIAACLGATFSASTISVVIRGLCIHSGHSSFFRQLFNTTKFFNSNEIAQLLEKCRHERLVQKSQQPTMLNDDSQSGASLLTDESQNHSDKTNGSKSKKKKSRMYQFVHDKIQEAALSMIPDERQLSELKYRIGEILLFGMAKNEVDDTIFTLIGLVNARRDLMPSASSTRFAKLIELNYMAGTKAIQRSAFQLGLSCMETCMEMMASQDSGQLIQASDHGSPKGVASAVNAIDVYSAAAECAYVVADNKKAVKYCQAIMSMDRPILQKVQAYTVAASALVAGTDEKEEGGLDAVQLLLDISEKLGCQFPEGKTRRKFAMLCSMYRMKRKTKKLSIDTTYKLKILSNENNKDEGTTTDLMVRKCMQILIGVAHLVDPALLVLSAAQTVERTLANGISKESPAALMNQAMVIGYFMGDFKRGNQLCQVALQMVEQLEMDGQNVTAVKANALLFAHNTTLHWTCPIRDSIGPLYQAHQLGMESGDSDAAVWSRYICTSIRFHTGASTLEAIDTELSIQSKLCADFNKQIPQMLTRGFCQTVLNLRGHSEHDVLLIGDAFDERENLDGTINSMAELKKLCVTVDKTFLSAYFAEYITGADLTSSMCSAWLQSFPGSPSLPPLIFLGGLCCYAASTTAATRKDRARFHQAARKCHKTLKGWKKKGHTNYPHYIHLLNAERKVAAGRHQLAVQHYSLAIEGSHSEGCIQDEAIANERLAHCWVQLGEKGTARRHFDNSLKLFKAWGADRKVELLHTTAEEACR
eukprot:CAMPEP_0119546620 /NCGR_PEP_ID=MMETSP1352-20130426/962_1 /TAXON_ID=265584 /ORGANISM="Stauroneis constricta, Strain CCMP1120" /LENGTH=1298 /DNA_ID=CAMNT_0007591341 /DNA_START=60 /DNA_END=3956 /DNA_ORIENTATION=-